MFELLIFAVIFLFMFFMVRDVSGEGKDKPLKKYLKKYKKIK